MSIKNFPKERTLPCAITVGTFCYLLFYYIPSLDKPGDFLGPIFDTIFPFLLFLILLVTYCKVDFHQLRPHRWHLCVILAQLMLVILNVLIIFHVSKNVEQKVLWESVLTCVIAPCATAAPVVTGKLGGNINTMTTFTLLSSLIIAILIPAVFPLIENTVHISFWSAFLIILEKVATVLVLPLILAYFIRHYLHRLHQWIVSKPDLGFYLWGISLSITTGITVKNIVHSNSTATLLLMVALLSLIACILHFFIGRAIGRRYGEHINTGQAMFQKNTALAIWVSYMYLNPVASIGAGCYVLWQNIINSVEIWEFDRNKR